MLKEVWLDIEIKKTDTYKGVTIKALLDSGAMGIFIDRKTVAKHGFKLQKLERLVRVKNIDCYDLAKWLSHFLFLFSIFISFI